MRSSNEKFSRKSGEKTYFTAKVLAAVTTLQGVVIGDGGVEPASVGDSRGFVGVSCQTAAAGENILVLQSGDVPGTAHAIAAGKIVTVSKFEFGKQWAFNREEVMLECRTGNALFVINPSTLAQYPLNDIATDQMKSGYVLAKPLDVLLLDDSNKPGQKMSLEPFQQRAMSLCQK